MPELSAYQQATMPGLSAYQQATIAAQSAQTTDPISWLIDYHQARFAPQDASTMSAKEEADLRIEYRKQIGELVKIDADLKQGAMTGYTEHQKALLQSMTGVLSAVASGKMASAVAMKGVSDAFGAMSPLIKQLTDVAWMNGDSSAVTAYITATGVEGAGNIPANFLKTQGSWDEMVQDKGSPEIARAFLEQEVEKYSAQSLNSFHSYLRGSSPDGRMHTALRMWDQYEGNIIAGLGGEARRIAHEKMMEKKAQYFSTEFGNSWESQVETAQLEGDNALGKVLELSGFADTLRVGGLPESEVQMALGMIRGANKYGNVSEYAEGLNLIETTPGLKKALDGIEADLAALDAQHYDPWSRAKADFIRTMGQENFLSWSVSMGFASGPHWQDRAVLYAANHAPKVAAWQQATAKDPTLLDTSAGFKRQRQKLAELGFRTSKIERATGINARGLFHGRGAGIPGGAAGMDDVSMETAEAADQVQAERLKSEAAPTPEGSPGPTIYQDGAWAYSRAPDGTITIVAAPESNQGAVGMELKPGDKYHDVINAAIDGGNLTVKVAEPETAAAGPMDNIPPESVKPGAQTQGRRSLFRDGEWMYVKNADDSITIVSTPAQNISAQGMKIQPGDEYYDAINGKIQGDIEQDNAAQAAAIAENDRDAQLDTKEDRSFMAAAERAGVSQEEMGSPTKTRYLLDAIDAEEDGIKRTLLRAQLREITPDSDPDVAKAPSATPSSRGTIAKDAPQAASQNQGQGPGTRPPTEGVTGKPRGSTATAGPVTQRGKERASSPAITKPETPTNLITKGGPPSFGSQAATLASKLAREEPPSFGSQAATLGAQLPPPDAEFVEYEEALKARLPPPDAEFVEYEEALKAHLAEKQAKMTPEEKAKAALAAQVSKQYAQATPIPTPAPRPSTLQ